MDSHDLNLNLPTSPCIPLIKASSQVRDEECFFWRHSSLSASFDFFPLHPQTCQLLPGKKRQLIHIKKIWIFFYPSSPSVLAAANLNKQTCHVGRGCRLTSSKRRLPPCGCLSAARDEEVYLYSKWKTSVLMTPWRRQQRLCLLEAEVSNMRSVCGAWYLHCEKTFTYFLDIVPYSQIKPDKS